MVNKSRNLLILATLLLSLSFAEAAKADCTIQTQKPQNRTGAFEFLLSTDPMYAPEKNRANFKPFVSNNGTLTITETTIQAAQKLGVRWEFSGRADTIPHKMNAQLYRFPPIYRQGIQLRELCKTSKVTILLDLRD